VELWEAPIWDSARKHGISDEAIRHALRNNVRALPDLEDDNVWLSLALTPPEISSRSAFSISVMAWPLIML
jgi:hypothetical protein